MAIPKERFFEMLKDLLVFVNKLSIKIKLFLNENLTHNLLNCASWDCFGIAKTFS